MYTEDSVLKHIAENNIELIDLQFTDILGVTKSVTILSSTLEEVFERGLWFDGSSIYGFARIQESDMRLKPDAVTYRPLPWITESPLRARVICDILDADGDPFTGDPRTTLRRAVAKANSMGFDTFNVGPEIEFFLLRKGSNGSVIDAVPNDIGGYFDFSPGDEAERVRSEITITLQKMGINVEMNHHEVASGQHEIDFRYSDALHSADNTVTVKYVVKGIAAKHGLIASFMPKPIFGQNGSGMHCHQSLFNNGENAFFDPNDEYHLSETAYQFMAGSLHHSKALCAVVAPIVNSYKRLTPGYEAPVYICWAQRNRSSLVRVPRYTPGYEKSVRMELRCPDTSANPYLAMAVMLEAGLDGISKKMVPAAAVSDDVYGWTEAERIERGVGTLPGTLSGALDALAEDKVIQEALGDHIYEVYNRAKRTEWDEYRIQVSNWELERYLETV